MNITIFTRKDLKKQGGFKKRNNSKNYTEQEFIQVIKDYKYKLSKGYIDNIGYIDNTNYMFNCNYNGIIIGVTGIINKLETKTK